MSNNLNKITRIECLLNEVLIIDGLPGCGKTLFNSVLETFERVELLQFSPVIENLCALYELEKIDYHALETLIKIELDLMIYESMMSRNTNFRYKDLSSVIRSSKKIEYFNRLFSKGEELVPNAIITKKPILHLATHNLLSYSLPIFNALGEKLKMIEIVRHPLYMIIQQSLNYESIEKTNGARQFYVHIKKKNKSIPFWTHEWKENFHSLNYVEKAILEIYYFTKRTSKIKKLIRSKNLISIPFENFVINPLNYLNQIENFIKSKKTASTSKRLKREKVPRRKIADGIPLEIYKRCGWVPSNENLNEREELKKRREFAINQGVKNRFIEILDKLSFDYEKEYNLKF